MNREQFAVKLEEKLNERMPKGYELDKRVVNKNGVEMDAVICKAWKEGGIAPVFYTDNLFDLFNDGETMDSIVEHIIEQSVSVQVDNDMDTITGNLNNKDYVLDNVYAVLVGENAKSQIDEQDLIYEPFHDMFIIYEIEVTACGNVGRVKVSNKMAENCGITADEIKLCGKCNARDKQSYSFTDLGEVLGFGRKTGQYVLTNNDGYKGAYAVLCADLKQFADKVGSNLILLPSSIHEWLVVAEPLSLEQAETMVREVNNTEVKPEERLSYKPYYYDRENETLSEMVA